MQTSEFLRLAEATLDAIDTGISEIADNTDVDVEASRSGNVLTIECEGSSKIIVNLQEPMQEIWLAARSGGFHFRHSKGHWVDTRNGDDLFRRLSSALSEQCGAPVELKARA
jgi:CyaY protein